jgi:hypothetical protein
LRLSSQRWLPMRGTCIRSVITLVRCLWEVVTESVQLLNELDSINSVTKRDSGRRKSGTRNSGTRNLGTVNTGKSEGSRDWWTTGQGSPFDDPQFKVRCSP